MRVVVVIPTFNEAENIRPLLAELLLIASWPDVLVVDDNSPDGTADVVTALAGTQPRVRLLRRPGKAGLGRAYLAGFDVALDNNYEVVVQMDADASHDPADVDRLVAALADADADVAVGSRYVSGGRVDGWPWQRRALSRAGNRYAQAWLGAAVHDWTGGFKAWRAETLRAIDLAAVRADGYAFQIELTARALARGARVAEVPIVFRDRSRGASKMTTAIALEALRVVPGLRDRSAARP